MFGPRPVKLLLSACLALIGTIALVTASYIVSTRQNGIVDTERELGNTAHILAQHTERTLQAVVLVQDSISEHVRVRGLASVEQFDAEMSTLAVHQMLLNKISGLPFVDTVLVASARGRLINFTRMWPIPEWDLSQAPHLQTIMSDPGTGLHVSRPLRNHVNGAWTIYIGRRITSPNGETLGFILAGIALEHFQKFFASIALTGDSSIMLLRVDGVLLVRYPHIEVAIGRDFGNAGMMKRLLGQGVVAATATSISPIDGVERLLAGRRLSTFPIAVGIALTKSAALADWRRNSIFLAVAATVACMAIAAMFALIIRDLNRRQTRTQQEMAAQKLQLDVALDHMAQGLCMYDSNARLVVCNERYIQLFGLSRDVMRPGAAIRDVISHVKEKGCFTGDPDQYVDELLETVARGQVRIKILETAGGRTFCAVQQPIETGGWVVTVEDITERRHVELERDRNREFLNRVIDNIPSVVIVKDAVTRRFVLINKAGEQLWGMPRENIVGKTAADFFDKEVADVITANEERELAAHGDLFFDEHPFTAPSGKTLYVTARSICIRAHDGTPQYLLAVLDDVTERRAVQQQLQQAQKMEAVGRLTGGLAHDFNNLLLIMIGNLDLLAEEVKDNPDAAEKVDVVLQSSLRGADLTRQLLAFSRRQSLMPRRLSLNDLIENTSKLLQRTLGENIGVELNLIPDLWPVAVDESQLEAALVNIAINARDAMPNGGRLVVETRNTALDRDYCEKHVDLNPGEFVEIDVTDNGTGMPPEVLARVFEPFFTTKDPARGTGLGLSTVFGFMRQSGGHITAYSEVGLGTTFKLYLPRAKGEAASGQERAAAAVTAPVGTPHQTILVVEDNPEIRAMVVKQLTELGYQVLEAENAMDALERLATASVDLMFTDMVMPGKINGKQLAWIARFKQPALKVLFTSGFPGSAEIQGAQLEPDDVLLRKPYRKADLARAVRDVLDTTAGDRAAPAAAATPHGNGRPASEHV